MKSILYLTLFLLFSSCDKNNETEETDTVIGKWSLVQVTAGFSPKETYDSGVILWEFNVKNQIVVDINSELDKSSNVPIKNDGTYNFEFIENKIKIENIEYEYLLDAKNLTLLDQVASDGPKLEFIKID